MNGAECIDTLLKGYKGLLQSDGYVGYTSWLNKKKPREEKAAIIHAACWAHARRKFKEVPDHPVAPEIVKLIAKLYRIETTLRDKPALDRAAYRREHSAPVLEKIKSVLETERFR